MGRIMPRKGVVRDLEEDIPTNPATGPNAGLVNPQTDLQPLQSVVQRVGTTQVDDVQGSEQADGPLLIPPFINELNEKHAVVMLGGKCTILNETWDPALQRRTVTFSTVSDFKAFYLNRKIDNDGQPSRVSIAEEWLVSPNRRQFQGVVFSPGKTVPGYYNLYRGFACQPIQGDWGLLKNHIWENIARTDEKVYWYILGWMARIVKDPGGERPGTSLVLRGKQGTGKGCFATQFGLLFGSHFLHITNQNQLVGRFNLHLTECLVAFVDEGFWAGDKSGEGVIKGLVTEKDRLCEPKGKDLFMVENHLNLIVASNHDWVIPAGLEERRFFVLDVADTHAQDHKYFAAIFQQMQNGGREAMLYELQQLDISKINLRVFPRTEALMDQIEHSMSTVQKFWYERLCRGYLVSPQSEWGGQVEISNLYNQYLGFAEQVNDRHPLTDSLFGKELKNLCPEIVRRKPTLDSGRRGYVYRYPDLATCRKQFEKLVKMEIDWDS